MFVAGFSGYWQFHGHVLDSYTAGSYLHWEVHRAIPVSRSEAVATSWRLPAAQGFVNVLNHTRSCYTYNYSALLG
jgi:hypothetical protein